ncbi:alkylhydroperoxidase AhpD family core domain-containing protein [Amycolatopsis tolypomycina]|uniref:Alkylhydroperoxidase AhpD family core domain-containing protein n=2 Tax=Amycolatopsis tolypomycina TaxID=208445 RepID=A0A1H4ZZ03_9PSEU|nr:alkylhydroperoxidase AhpD family core domain-containing protein [Amycolatopsis tolypomycina]
MHGHFELALLGTWEREFAVGGGSMAPGLVRFALRRAVQDVKHVEAVRPRRAKGQVRAVYRQLERDFGMLAPPIALHSPSPPVLAAAWLVLRESLVAAGVSSRADREVVAAAVSAANACPYCVEVHAMAVGALGDPGTAAALEAGTPGEIADPDARELAGWARGAGPLPPGVPAEAAAEFTAVATAFHYLNRMVAVFLGDSPLPDRVPASARGKAKAVLGHFLRPGQAPPAGRALELLPATGVDGPDWAPPGSTLADAFARAGVAVEAAGERVLPPRVRELVRRELKAWDGRPPGLGRSWADAPLAELPAAERPAARLALLVAKAAYQVDDEVVVAARRDRADDRGLIELVSWAAHAAAEELGSRLSLRPRGEDVSRGRG